DASPPYTDEELDRYVEAWSQPRAAAGMINRSPASVRQSQKDAAANLRPISAPPLVAPSDHHGQSGFERVGAGVFPHGCAQAFYPCGAGRVFKLRVAVRASSPLT